MSIWYIVAFIAGWLFKLTIDEINKDKAWSQWRPVPGYDNRTVMMRMNKLTGACETDGCALGYIGIEEFDMDKFYWIHR